MSQNLTLGEMERLMRHHVSTQGLDLEAARAVSSIYRAANAIRTYATKEVLRPHGLTWTGFVVMWVVWIRDGIETRQAAEAAAISRATLTGVVNTLQSRGWMRRCGLSRDRRLVELRLTEAGRALMENVYPEFNRLEQRVVAGLSGDRTRQLTSSLHGIVHDLDRHRHDSGRDGSTSTPDDYAG